MADFLIDANLPYSTAQQPSLKKLLDNATGRNIKIPYPKRIMSTIGRKFDSMKNELKNLLKKQKYVCATCDVWTARAKRFLGVTVHFISKKYQRRSYVLGFRQLEGKQTFEVLAKEMSDIFKEYGLTVDKITNVVTDGGSAFCKSFRIYGRRNEELLIEERTDEPDSNEENMDVMPFMQDDGEYYTSNIIDFSNLTEREQSQPDDEFSLESIEENELLEPTEPISPHEIIQLPPQMRCVSYMLNLISGDFDKALDGSIKTALVSAKSKLHSL